MIPAVRGILDRFPAQNMQDGDGFLQNDPWSGGTHLPDIIIVRPVRADDRTVALAATILHHQDVGGLAAGSVPPDARDIFQEGLRIPPVQWRRAGTEDAGIAAILAANSRAPDLLRGDLGAQWAAVSLGAREVGELVQSMGLTAFAAASDALIDHARRMTEAALGRLPDGVAIAEDALDGEDGRPRLLLDGAVDHVAVSVLGHLAGDEDEVAGAHGRMERQVRVLLADGVVVFLVGHGMRLRRSAAGKSPAQKTLVSMMSTPLMRSTR